MICHYFQSVFYCFVSLILSFSNIIFIISSTLHHFKDFISTLHHFISTLRHFISSSFHPLRISFVHIICRLRKFMQLAVACLSPSRQTQSSTISISSPLVHLQPPAASCGSRKRKQSNPICAVVRNLLYSAKLARLTVSTEMSQPKVISKEKEKEPPRKYPQRDKQPEPSSMRPLYAAVIFHETGDKPESCGEVVMSWLTDSDT